LSALPDRNVVPLPLSWDGAAPACVLGQGMETLRLLGDGGALGPTALFDLTTSQFAPPELHVAFGASEAVLRDHAVARACPRPRSLALYAGKVDVDSVDSMAVLTPLGAVFFGAKAKGRVRVAALGSETIVRVELTDGPVWAITPGARAELGVADAGNTDAHRGSSETDALGVDIPSGFTLHVTRPRPNSQRRASIDVACASAWTSWQQRQSSEPLGRKEGRRLAECALAELFAEAIALP
jgi:hypothetical protein